MNADLKGRDDYSFVRIVDSIRKEKDIRYLVIWRKSDCDEEIKSWHSLEELLDLGYLRVTQSHENTGFISSTSPIIAAKEEFEEEEMKDIEVAEKDTKNDDDIEPTVVKKFVKNICDIADRIADAAETYLKSPSSMISESLLPKHWRTG